MTTPSQAPMAAGGPGIDRPLFTTITDFADNTRWLNEAMLLWTDAALVLFGVLMVAGWWLARGRDDRSMALALLAPVSVVATYMVAEVVKVIVAEPRPCRGVPTAYFVDECPVLSDYSFPSGHTTTAAATVTVLFLLNRRLGWITLVIALLEGFSRVYVGAHYPHDVLGAAVLAVPVALAITLLLVRPATTVVHRLRESALAPLVAETAKIPAARR
ncbi:phosphatase PAP2 family protein [Nocardia vermiculata]|uniref:Phosphatase PAP2 family protein n=1 Tax=Nocardia vermiculata TaxID=257274 RepID=A0A846Y745_9NOCA|nr:phosphatase PAP2 family protein [Nocardia vermiculata]NKY53531.1 phosphatase PAP2 family protein [Nocardia vermiculata]